MGSERRCPFSEYRSCWAKATVYVQPLVPRSNSPRQCDAVIPAVDAFVYRGDGQQVGLIQSSGYLS